MDSANIQDIISLSPLQEGILYQYINDRNNDIFHEQFYFEIQGHINDSLFKRACEFIVSNNEMLRTVFKWENLKKPVQIVLKRADLNYKYLGNCESVKETWNVIFDNLLKDDKNNRFKIDETVPFRIYLLKSSSHTYQCLISHHHILLDGWSNSLIINEIKNACGALMMGEELVIKQGKSSYKEYIKKINSQDITQIRIFWQNFFRDTSKVLYQKSNDSNSNDFKNCSYSLPNDFIKILQQFSENKGQPVSSIIFLAWFILLYKIEHSDDIIFHSTFSGRHVKIKGIEGSIGLYINTLPLRMKMENKSFSELLAEVNNILSSIEDFQLSPINIVSEYVPGNYNYYNTLMVIENYPFYSIDTKVNQLFSVENVKYVEKTSFDITHIISIGKQWESKYCYNSLIINEEKIKWVHELWVQILESIIQNNYKNLNNIFLSNHLNNTKLNKLSDHLVNRFNARYGILIDKLKNSVQQIEVGEIYVDQNIHDEPLSDGIQIGLDELFPTGLIGKLNSKGEIEEIKRISYAKNENRSNIVPFKNQTVIENLNSIWEEILGFVPGPHDNFFEIGGDSIKLVRLYKSINHNFPKRITINDLFENPTIEKLNSIIEDKTEKKQEINFIEF